MGVLPSGLLYLSGILRRLRFGAQRRVTRSTGLGHDCRRQFAVRGRYAGIFLLAPWGLASAFDELDGGRQTTGRERQSGSDCAGLIGIGLFSGVFGFLVTEAPTRAVHVTFSPLCARIKFSEATGCCS